MSQSDKIFVEGGDIDSFILASVYNQSGNNREFKTGYFWEDFFDFFEQFDNVLLTGDFNAKSDLWNATVSRDDTDGSRIHSVSDNSLLVCLNNPFEYTRMSEDASSRSSIDLTFVSSNMVDECEWKTLPYNYESDHFPILIKTKIKYSNKNKIRGKYNCKKVDWNHFNNLCRRDLQLRGVDNVMKTTMI